MPNPGVKVMEGVPSKGRVCKENRIVCKGDGMMCEGQGMSYEGDGKVCKGDNMMVCESKWMV